MLDKQSAQQIIAIDFGMKRIGVAVGNSLTANAQPLCTITTDKPFQVPSELLKLIKEWQPNKLIMGMPYTLEGDESKISKDIRRFAAVLSEETGMPVEFIDESFSSQEANKQLTHLRRNGQRSKRVGKGDIDKAAAAIMLQRWLDQPL